VIESMLVLGGGGREFLCRMVALFLQDAPQRLAAIDDAVTRADARGVAQAAHALKSSSANLGASALAQMCRGLEQYCRGGEIAEAAALAAAIEDELAYVTADLSGRVREPAA
jgi:HPt (histidine-containing phosphotransfer) domain-containing protein